jgi:hypothetical protein
MRRLKSEGAAEEGRNVASSYLSNDPSSEDSEKVIQYWQKRSAVPLSYAMARASAS